MIPVQLILKNFLSYQDATLDFNGLHTACICGSNGAGKSSLLEAITWAIWGESRASTEDDVIQTGAKEVRVDFTFSSNDHNYRVIRTRYRGQSSGLEFQVATPSGFKALTEKGLRATQQAILDHIKLDYDTFINSAYLRQGRADEFMLKRPTERKEILAELLKLNQYDDLEERAKDLSRSFKGQAEQLDRLLESIQGQLQQRSAIAQQRIELEEQVNQLQQAQAYDNVKVQSLQVVQHQRQNWQQQLGFLRQQHQNLSQDSDRLEQEQAAANGQLAALRELLGQQKAITEGYSEYQRLQAQEEAFSAKFQEHTRATVEMQQLQQEKAQQINEIQRQLQHAEGQLAALQQQEQEIEQTLSKVAEVQSALAQLAEARQRLQQLDRLQLEVSPLLQQQTSLQMQLERSQARILAKIEELQTSEQQLSSQQQRQPHLQQAVMEVGVQIDELEKKRVYLDRVREKGQERRHFLERLHAHQRDYEKQIGELEQKMQMLQNPDAVCPLCDRPLDKHHWDRVVQKTQSQQQEVQDQFWVSRDQMAATDSEIQTLRQEYRQLLQEVAQYDALREQRGKLTEQLAVTDDTKERLKQIATEKQKLERSLSSGDHAADKQAQLQQVQQQLRSLNYSEQDHALARSEIERWRWAEIRQAQIKDAQKRQAQIAARKPEIQAQIAELQAKIDQQDRNSPCAIAIATLESHIQEIGYNLEQHNALRSALRQSQAWQLRHQQLISAQQQYPELQQRVGELNKAKEERLTEKQLLAAQIESLVQQLERSPDPTAEIQNLEQKLAFRRRELDDLLSHLGMLQQQSAQLDALQIQSEQQQQQLQDIRQQHRIYQELAQAFGKNGIQALMIENVLPQLEAETNQLLARLSANQLHVQFVTQKAGRSGKAAKKNAKLIDTLEIVIADARGTRAYETYSGGEAFRINFAIRLALAKLLAQRSGASLQMLIVDEGFGTQDREGCDRLIAAINAIAPDFACILAVTHMPYFKEAFQARIEVHKTQTGSHLSLSM
ncbi:exonuclease subunit SbcC [Aliterella atlantica]|uniref:Nuclease SbcCD subunit C n=1 Tax=Aliterella atlantica CENA595 TaxID=1618023 RepID=A0A0D8ZV98_9CYAN|nr:SMC family ATPase [Aliterella atlantica]KJH72302.1 exonuclease SbcC [Aliterella atlantica CENA595]